MKHLKADIEKAIAEKLITVQKHPTEELYIYNYSAVCQYDRIWTEATLNCRGLILTKEFEVVARPFPKYFNIEELKPEEIPNEPFIVMAKVDGSLGVLYFIGDTPYIATRGSFTSDQAIKATEMLHTKYKHTWGNLKAITDMGVTVLFEIIYFENRIVLKYDKEELILLAIRENKDLKDIDGNPTNPYFNLIWHQNLGFPVVKKYDGLKDFTKLKEMIKDDEEGFVIRWTSGKMAKIKGNEYVRLHKILTQTSNIAIYDLMRSGTELNDILERIPDEFNSWVRKTKEGLEKEYANIEAKSKIAYASIMLELCNEYIIPNDSAKGRSKTSDITISEENYYDVINTLVNTNAFKEKFKKKDYALKVLANYRDISGVLFNMVDGRDYKDIIWKLCRPDYERPFTNAGKIEG